MPQVCYPFRRKRGRHRAVKRRQFITLLGGAAAWPFAAGAQQPVGILSPISATGARPLIAAFRSVLRDLGYLEGQNVTIAIRYGEGAPERMAWGKYHRNVVPRRRSSGC
jgi:hypothetical protein